MANITNIFTSKFDHDGVADSVFPQASYLFKVSFDGTDIPGEMIDTLVNINNDDSAVSITATLPKAQTKTVTQWYKGTPKTRIVNMDRSGETTLTFILRRNGFGALASLFHINGFDIDSNNDFKHEEFETLFNKIEIYTLKTNRWSPGKLINNKNISSNYTLYNCVVTNLDFGEVSYESSEYLKLIVTVHYDYWSAK